MKVNLEQTVVGYDGLPVRQGETLKRMEEIINAMMAALPEGQREPFITAYSQLPVLTIKDLLMRAATTGLQGMSPDQLRAVHRIARRFADGPEVELSAAEVVVFRLAVSCCYTAPLYLGTCMDALEPPAPPLQLAK